jgi:hypothetical protein
MVETHLNICKIVRGFECTHVEVAQANFKRATTKTPCVTELMMHPVIVFRRLTVFELEFLLERKIQLPEEAEIKRSLGEI